MGDVALTAPTSPASLQEAPALLAELITSQPSIEALLPAALTLIRAAFGVEYARIVVIEEHQNHIHLLHEEPDDTPFAEQLPEAVYMQRQPVVVADLRKKSPTRLGPRYADEGLVALLCQPIVLHEQCVGIVEIAHKRRHTWSEAERTTMRVLASQLAPALALYTLQANSERRSQEIATLNDIAATITSTLDPRQVYRLVVQKINEYFRVEAGSLLLLDAQTDELVFVMTLEAGEEKLANVRVPPGQGLVGEVIRTRQPLIVLDAQNDPRFYKKVSEDVGFITRSVLCVPMLVKGREIGVIQLLNKIEGEFDEEDAARLSAMSNTIAVAIDNANLFQEVAQNRNRLQAILNSTEDAILSIDTNDVVVTANPMVQEIFGLSWQKLMGQAGSQILAEIEQRTRVINGGDREASVVDLEVLRPQTRFVRRVTLPVYSAANEEIGKLIVFHDITQEHELTRMRDDYTGMLVHDLRAPLTAIINGMTMVRRGFAGPINEQQRELLDIANNSSQEMVGMINTLLDISKLEAGQLVLNRAPCSVYDIAERAAERLITSARSANIDLRTELPLNLPIIDVDQDKLVRVLQNLLDNAIKFTPLNGAVVLKAVVNEDDLTGPEIAWSVIDTGPGIPEEYRSRIFDKFVQVGQRKGTGLGLAFAKLATEAHGGRIWVESVEGEGSTFTFTTPFTPA